MFYVRGQNRRRYLISSRRFVYRAPLGFPITARGISIYTRYPAVRLPRGDQLLGQMLLVQTNIAFFDHKACSWPALNAPLLVLWMSLVSLLAVCSFGITLLVMFMRKLLTI